MRITPKKTAAKTRRPSRITRPKKPSLTVEIPQELLAEDKNYLPPLRKPSDLSPTTRSAHDVEKGVVTPCYVCGGECDQKTDRWGPWRRHEECTRITQPWERVRAAALWFSVECTDNECWSAELLVPDYADVHPSAVYSEKDADRSPWSHVSMKDVAVAVLTARQELAETETAKACATGACAWCGTAEAVEWADHGHHRDDGSPAPLCPVCSPIFDRLPGSVDYYEDQRGGIAEAISGVPSDMGEEHPAALRAHAEVGGGDGTAWSHLNPEAVEAFRWSRWARAGGAYAPPEHKAEALARMAALEAARAARVADEEAADPFGFHGSEREAEGS